jgi:hypothetical protein
VSASIALSIEDKDDNDGATVDVAMADAALLLMLEVVSAGPVTSSLTKIVDC